MNTTTKKATTAPAPVAETIATTEQNAVAVFQPPRLPYHQAIKERFGVEPSGWKALVEAVYPAAKTVDAVVMALSYCKARNLDPFKRPVHIVPMWSAKGGDDGKGGYVETIWPGISELRTTAFRTGNYAGCDEAEFGPPVEKTFSGKVQVWKEGKKVWETKEITLKFPEWCRMTVYRMLAGTKCRFVGPKVKWIEAYAALGKSELPNDMWESRPEGQLEKCTEAAALRKAFPEELGNELTSDEMFGRTLRDDHDNDAADRVVRSAASNEPPPTVAAVRAAQAASKATAAPETKPEPQPDEIVVEEPSEAEPIDPKPTQTGAKVDPKATAKGGTAEQTSEFANWRKDAEGALGGCTDQDQLAKVHKEIIKPAHNKVPMEEYQAVIEVYTAAFHRIALEEAKG